MIYNITFLFGYLGILYSLIAYITSIFGINNIPNWNPDTQIFVLLLSCIVVNTSLIAEKKNVNIK